MSGKIFVDTNILIYAYDAGAGEKGRQAERILRELWQNRSGILSVQVLQEFYVNVTRKIAHPLPKSTAREILRLYGAWVSSATTVDTVLRASEISDVWQISFWDSLIIAAAEEARAATLLSEDLNAGQVIAGIEIVNPFAAAGAGNT